MSNRQQNSGQTSADAATLRKRAEEQARTMEPISLPAQAPEAIEQMLHELRVHQIELEMQNEELRRAQAEIEDGRARYFDLYDLAPVGYCTLSEKGLILEANLTAATLLGVARRALIKQPISRFILKEDQDIYFLHRKQLFEADEPQQCDLRLVKPDGTPFWAHLTRTSARGQDGGLVCRVVISDITEHKRAKDEQQRNLRMLARTEYLANIGSWEWDIDADCTRWSEELFRIFQRDPAFGAPSLAEHPDIYVAEDMERLWAAVEKCISNGTPYELELRAIRMDGMIRQCVARGKAECDETGRIIRLVGSLQDITERKEAEKKLRKSESLFRTLVNTIPDLIWLKDADGVYLACNKRFERFFGASETEICGRTDYDFVDKEQADSFRENDRKALAVGGPSRNEEQITETDDGHTVFLETIKTPMFDSDGNLVGVLGIGRDITERKQAEEALKEASVRVSLATKAGGVGVWEYDLVHNRLQWDEQMYALYGTSRDAFDGAYESWRTGVHPDDIARCDQEVAMALRGEKEFGTEFRVVWPDGTVRHIQALAMVLRDADGKPLRMIGTNWDITEHKQAVEENRIFKTIADNAEYGKAIADLEGNLLYVNRFLANIHGYEPEQLLGKHLSLFHSQDQMELVDRLNATMRQEGYFATTTVCHRHQDGRSFPMLMSGNLIKDDYGSPQCMAVSAIDMSAHHLAQEALRESEERFRSYFNLPLIGFASSSLDKGFIEINERLCEILGYAREELITLTWTAITHPEDVERDVAQFNLILEGVSENYSLEKRFIRKDGSVIHGSISVCCVRKPDRTINYFVALVQDITDSKQAEAEREKLQSQLQRAQKMEAIGTLAGGIAHDFNNILGAILGYAELAQEDSPVGSILRKDIDQIVKASHRATELVKQILAFSRQAEIERIPLRPAPIIKEALKMLRSSLPSTIAIEQDIDQKAGPLLADPTQIHQIVVNLCTNAFHAMEKTGGTLSISLKSRDLTRDDHTLDPHVHPGRFVQLTIGDTGPGIAPEILEKIFEPYFTTKEVGKGTGMGLAIVHGIATSYKGFVTCHSVLGQGTVFHVYLPVIAAPALLDPLPTPLDPQQLHNERILFVDDEEILAEMGKVMLERLGYVVTVSRNSLEALHTFQAQPDQFDLVITDQTMPGMTGMDMARRMLQIRPGMPIILCTGFSNLVDEELAKRCGIKSFMMKPLAKKELAAVLRQVLDDCSRP